MNHRYELHELLCKILGSRNVYFQPPENVRLKYPCIVYERSDIRNSNAENDVYRQTFHYMITVIDPDPDSIIVNSLSKQPKIRFNRHFVMDGLNHDVFSIYY